MKRIDELTGLRGIAIGMVLLGHATQIMSARMARFVYGDFGGVGVQVFFVLSGFLITTLLMHEYERTGTTDLRGFYRRRLVRIWPAFYVFLAVLGFFAASGLIKVGWQSFLIAGTYSWNYAQMLGLGHTDGNGWWYLGHMWSLALEEQYYLVWPIIFLIIMRHNLHRLVWGVILIVPIIRVITYVTEPDLRGNLSMMFHTGIDTIIVGSFMALNRVDIERSMHRIMHSATVLSLLVIMICVVLPLIVAKLGGYWSVMYGNTLAAGMIGLLILCTLRQPNHLFCRILRSKPLVFVGMISYSLYLWQQLFNHPDSPVFMAFPLNIVGSVAAACLSYFFVERPCLAYKDRMRKAADRANIPAMAAQN